MVRDVAMPERLRLRLDRLQRAREEGLPAITVFAGSESVARTHWSTWLRAHRRESVCVTLGEDPPRDASQLAAAMLTKRSATYDTAAFVARHTGECREEVATRLHTLARPERVALLEHVTSASQRPHSTHLAAQWLDAPDRPPLVGDTESLCALIELRPPLERPGLLVVPARIEHGLDLLVPLCTALPGLPIAVVVEPHELDRFLLRPDATRVHLLVRQGVIRLDDTTETFPTSRSRLDVLRVELARACRSAPKDAETADRARSLAERLLFLALEDHAATRGRFALNVRMPFTFGPRAAEIDLYSRLDRIAIEVDGYFHFVDDEAYRRDRRKDALLQRNDLFVLRFLAQDVSSRLEEIVDEIISVLPLRSPSTSS